MVAIEEQSRGPIVLRAAVSTYLVLLGPCVFLFLLYVMGVAKRPSESLWGALAFIVGYGIFIFAWVRMFQIELDHDVLVYRSLFGGTRRVNIADIESARIQIGYRRYKDRSLPPTRLEVCLKTHVKESRLIINLKVFSRHDIALLMERIPGNRNPRPLCEASREFCSRCALGSG